MADNLNFAGEIAEITGEVKITRGDTGETIIAEKGTQFYEGDIIETAGNGAVNLKFTDDSTMALSENAELEIDEYIMDETGGGEGSSNFSVMKGLFVYTSGMIGQDDPDDVHISTPQGSIGIRGTVIAANTNTGEVSVLEGAIVMRDLSGNEITLSQQYETAKFQSGNEGFEKIGVLSAQDITSKFSTIAKVDGALFSTLNDASSQAEQTEEVQAEESAQEEIKQEAKEEAPKEDVKTQQDKPQHEKPLENRLEQKIKADGDKKAIRESNNIKEGPVDKVPGGEHEHGDKPPLFKKPPLRFLKDAEEQILNNDQNKEDDQNAAGSDDNGDNNTTGGGDDNTTNPDPDPAPGSGGNTNNNGFNISGSGEADVLLLDLDQQSFVVRSQGTIKQQGELPDDTGQTVLIDKIDLQEQGTGTFDELKIKHDGIFDFSRIGSLQQVEVISTSGGQTEETLLVGPNDIENHVRFVEGDNSNDKILLKGNIEKDTTQNDAWVATDSNGNEHILKIDPNFQIFDLEGQELHLHGGVQPGGYHRSFDFENIEQMHNVDTINLENDSSDRVVLNANDIFNIFGGEKLYINGDTGDRIFLGDNIAQKFSDPIAGSSEQQTPETHTANGNFYNVFTATNTQGQTATLFIETDVQFQVAANVV